MIPSIVQEAVLKSLIHDHFFGSKVMYSDEEFRERFYQLDLVSKIV